MPATASLSGFEMNYTVSAGGDLWTGMMAAAQFGGFNKHSAKWTMAVASTAVRGDWDSVGGSHDSMSVLFQWPASIIVLDHRRQLSYEVLPHGTIAAPPVWRRSGRKRKTPFGVAEEYLLTLPGYGAARELLLACWQVPGVVAGRWAVPVWQLVFPLVSAVEPSGLLTELSLGAPTSQDTDVVLRLTGVRSSEFPQDYFSPPSEYRSGQEVQPSIDKSSLPRRDQAASAPGAPVSGSRPLFAPAPTSERARLMVDGDLLGTAVDAVNHLASFAHELSGDDLVFRLDGLYDQLTANGDRSLTTGVLARIMLWQLGATLAAFDAFTTTVSGQQVPALRVFLDQLVAAAGASVGVASVAIPAGLDEEKAADARALRRLVGELAGRPTPIARFLETRNSQTALGLVGELDADQLTIARQWFLHRFGALPLDPEPTITQRAGRFKGWDPARPGHYVEQGIIELIDFEFNVGEMRIRRSSTIPLLEPLTPVDETDGRVAQARALGLFKDAPAWERVGLVTRVHIGEFGIGATALTTPAHTWQVVLLFFACAPCVLLLYQVVTGGLNVHDLEADALVLVRNDPFGVEDASLEFHLLPVTFSDVDFGAFSFNVFAAFPLLLPLLNVLLNLIGGLVAPSLVAAQSKAFSDMVDVSPGIPLRLQQLMRLDNEPWEAFVRSKLEAARRGGNAVATAEFERLLRELIENTPAGRNHFAIRHLGEHLGLELSIRAPGTAPALPFPPSGEWIPRTATLLLSEEVYRNVLSAAARGVGYEGPIKNIALSSRPTLAAPDVDWWNDAPEPGRLGPRPDLHPLPPLIVATPGNPPPPTNSYYAFADVTSSLVRLLPVNNPTPETAVGELEIVARFRVWFTTYRPVSYEVCEDATRLGLWVDRVNAGGKLEPIDPGDPVPPWADSLLDIRRIPSEQAAVQPPSQNLQSDVLDAVSEAIRRRRVLASPAFPASRKGSGSDFEAVGGLRSLGQGAICHIVTTFDVEHREEWLSARLSLTVPVRIGLGPSNLLNRPEPPLITLRVDAAMARAGELDELATSGPLAGLGEGANAPWVRELLRRHALAALFRNEAFYRLDNAPGLFYAYGLDGEDVTLQPEGFALRAVLGLHPNAFLPAEPVDGEAVLGRIPPTLSIETFGTELARPNLAMHFHLVTNVFQRILAST